MVPFLAPEPLQSLHVSLRFISIVLVAPRAASIRSNSIRARMSWPGLGPASPLAEHVAEEAAAEDVGEGGHDVLGVAEVVHPRAFEPGVAVAIVAGALLLVGEDLVRLGGLLELLLRRGVARVLVRVELQGHLPITLLDFLDRGLALDGQDLVIIALGRRHRHGISTRGTVVRRRHWASLEYHSHPRSATTRNGRDRRGRREVSPVRGREGCAGRPNSDRRPSKSR